MQLCNAMQMEPASRKTIICTSWFFRQEQRLNADAKINSDHAHAEKHYVNRTGWLRAAVLGANDGLLSTSSLMVGVAAAAVSSSQLLLTGVAGIVAGAMSMAAGEYVSVSSQSDSEQADIERERNELAADPEHERRELTAIYVRRGLSKALAMDVVDALSNKDELEAHARDELGITEASTAHPIQAALASAASFVIGGLPPIIAVLLAPPHSVLWIMAVAAIITLAILGAAGARAGGAPIWRGVVRVTIWGSLAMAVTAGVGHLFRAPVG
jgi:VIT1/CCC1 family predicted Fe2+/Mn2+ transporter